MIRTVVCAAMLSLLPALAYAGCSDSHQAMSCTEGTVWDAATQTCVEKVTG